MASLEDFSGEDLSYFGEEIRGIARQARSLEDAAGRIADFLWDELRTEDGAPAAALVRVYKTHPYGALPDDLRDFARATLDSAPEADMRCLTLLATRGLEPAWNDPRRSEGHKTIPLVSVEFVQRLPMVAGLIEQLGLELTDVVRPEQRKVAELAQRTYGVFHVAEARGSEFVPAQEFVDQHDIRSALGFGGVLFNGDFFAVVIFSRVPIPHSAAETLRVLSLAVRVAFMPFAGRILTMA